MDVRKSVNSMRAGIFTLAENSDDEAARKIVLMGKNKNEEDHRMVDQNDGLNEVGVHAQAKDTQLGTHQYRSGFKVVHGNNVGSFEQFRNFDPWAALTQQQQLHAHRNKFHSQVV